MSRSGRLLARARVRVAPSTRFERPRRARATPVRVWVRLSTKRGGALLLPDHVLGLHPLVELLGGQEPEFDGGGLQGLTLLVRGLRDLRGVVVSDVRIESGDEHQGV